MAEPECRVCGQAAGFFVENFKNRTFYQCPECWLIFEPESEKTISAEDKKKHLLDQWGSSPQGGYPECHPMALWLMASCGKNKMDALDFGCGYGGLIRHLRDNGVTAIGVDRAPVENDLKPFVFPSLEELPVKRFDAITMVEVIKRLHDPVKTLTELAAMLADDGFFFITTALTNRSLTSLRTFPYWTYQEDAAHVSFYHERTFETIARKLAMDLKIISDDRIVLDKRFDRVITPTDKGFFFANEKEKKTMWPPWRPADGADSGQ